MVGKHRRNRADRIPHLGLQDDFRASAIGPQRQHRSTVGHDDHHGISELLTGDAVSARQKNRDLGIKRPDELEDCKAGQWRGILMAEGLPPRLISGTGLAR